MSNKLTVISTGDNMWQEKPAILVKHIVTGEVMVYLDYFGDGYGSGKDLEVNRFNEVTGTYEKIRLSRKCVTSVENDSYQDLQSKKLSGKE